MADAQDIRNTVDPTSQDTGVHLDMESIRAAEEAAKVIANEGVSGAAGSILNVIKEVGTEQDGFVVGMRDDEVRAGFQEQTKTEVQDADGNVVSSDTFTYGAYVEADGDFSLEASRQGFEKFGDGATLSYGAQGTIGTEGIEGAVAGSYKQETDWGSYGGAAGFNFQAPADGGETNWSAAVVGEATYDGIMGNQFGVYAFGEAGVYADPSGVDPYARVGLGKDTALGDVRVGVTHEGGVGFSIGKSF